MGRKKGIPKITSIQATILDQTTTPKRTDLKLSISILSRS